MKQPDSIKVQPTVIVAILVLFSLLITMPASAGEIVAWGWNDEGECNVPEGSDFTQVAAGFEHSLALKEDGSIMAWGKNEQGQCDVPEGNDFTQVAAGFEHSLALKTDGSVVAWGDNYFDQCNVPEGNDFTQIAAGAFCSLALKEDGTFVGWGENFFSQCYESTDNDFTQLAAGDLHCLALRSDGSVVAWGGSGNMPAGNDFTQVAAGWDHSLALKEDGTIVQWGRGDGNVPEGNDFIQIATGWEHCLALRSDGSVVAWGFCWFGDHPEGNSFTQIAAGWNHCLALKEPDDPAPQPQEPLDITVFCPVDIEVTDPDGLLISKTVNEIPGATYTESDTNGDGEPDDVVHIPDIKPGDYCVRVIPEPCAGPSDTFTLTGTCNGQSLTFEDNCAVCNIQSQYILRATRSAGGVIVIERISGGYTPVPEFFSPVIMIACIAVFAGLALFVRRRRNGY